MKRLSQFETEIVETAKLAKSLKRLSEYRMSGDAWKRSLYHALLLSGHINSRDKMTAIRQSIELP